ncbi:MAG: acyl-CoA dehydrogenase family protein [Methylocystaceae bacterium]
MDFSLSKEQLLIQKAAREFADKVIAPAAEKIDKENIIPDEIMAGLSDLDLFGIPFAEEYGGAGSDYVTYLLALEQIARASMGVAGMIQAHCLTLSPLSYFGTPEQKQAYLPAACRGEAIASFAFTEPATGSDPRQIATTAVKDGDQYVINGTKRFITNSNQPGPAIIFARESTSGEVTAFVMDKFSPGYSVSEPWNKIGWHGGQLCDMYFHDVRVPAKNVLGEIGNGYPILQQGIAFGKVGMAATFLGGTLAALEEAIQYSKQKTHRDRPIANFQAIQLAIAEIAEKYEAAKWLTYHMGYQTDNLKDMRVFTKYSALTKDFVCNNMVDCVRLAVNVHGSYGLMDDYKIARLYRDAIIGPQIEGVSDLQKIIVAGALLKG